MMYQRLSFCALITSLIVMVSCAKDEARTIQCIDGNCSKETIMYPSCQDDDTLIISEDGTTKPCPHGCMDNHCIDECTKGVTKCLSDKVLQRCVDGSWVNKECEDKCIAGECIAPSETCHENEQRCSGLNAEICRDGQWTVSETCPFVCFDGKCQLCREDETRCSDSDVEICHDNQWTIADTCPFACFDGKCILCQENETRCADLNVEICHDERWEHSENCPYKCRDGRCVDDCRGNDVCRDENTLQQCIDNKWTTIVCENGCDNGKCKPKTQVDRRLTNNVCPDEDFWQGFCDDIFKEGAVCVQAGPSSAYCLARCDPQKTQKYYCELETIANVGDCMQISDGSYALIPTHIDDCVNSCSSKKGCDSIEDSYEIKPVYCDDFENYCDGNVAHYCEGVMDAYDCGHDSETCVQFESRIFCSQPCDVEGDVIYQCYDKDSVALTCVPDDNGTLTLQPNYGPIIECSKGCNEKTGHCK